MVHVTEINSSVCRGSTQELQFFTPPKSNSIVRWLHSAVQNSWYRIRHLGRKTIKVLCARGSQAWQLSDNSFHCSAPTSLSLQVQQRAQECIKALNLILKINSGEEVTNVLHSDFDWNSLKVSGRCHLCFVKHLIMLLVSPFHF